MFWRYSFLLSTLSYPLSEIIHKVVKKIISLFFIKKKDNNPFQNSRSKENNTLKCKACEKLNSAKTVG